MLKKIVSIQANEIEGVTGKSPVVIALTEDGKLFMRRLTTHTKGWNEISITEDSIVATSSDKE
jgi:hypothetical protein